MKDAETKLTIAKKVLLDELQEQLHTERVEDVISWALEYYAENKAESTHGKAIAYCIITIYCSMQLLY